MKTFTRVVAVADKPTQNGNIYPEAVLRKVVEESQERVKSRHLFGNATGKSPLLFTEVTHVVTGLRMENRAMVADIEFLDTPHGRAAVKAIEAVAEEVPGAALVLRLSGTGCSTPEGVVQDDYSLDSISVEWAAFEKDVREENAELNALMDRQHTRVREATQLWREETEEFLTSPDLGKLVQWLLERTTVAQSLNADLLGQLCEVQKAALTAMREYPPGSEGSKAFSAVFAFADTSSRSPSALFEENQKLKAAIREHAFQKGDDRCWLDDEKLYAAAGIDINETNTALPPEDEYLATCARYHASRQNPEHKYTTVDEKIQAAVLAERKRIADKLDHFKLKGRRVEFDVADIMELKP